MIPFFTHGNSYNYDELSLFKEHYNSSRFQDFLQAGRIKIEYNLSPIDVYKNLLKSKIVVMPSYSEAFGLAAMEGALAGNALVISNVGGLPEVIGNDKSRGYILPEISSQAVYNALVHLINHPVELEEMAKASQEYVRREFAPEEISAQYDKLYEL